jgi:hypothetical protein
MMELLFLIDKLFWKALNKIFVLKALHNRNKAFALITVKQVSLYQERWVKRGGPLPHERMRDMLFKL